MSFPGHRRRRAGKDLGLESVADGHSDHGIAEVAAKLVVVVRLVLDPAVVLYLRTHRKVLLIQRIELDEVAFVVGVEPATDIRRMLNGLQCVANGLQSER